MVIVSGSLGGSIKRGYGMILNHLVYNNSIYTNDLLDSGKNGLSCRGRLGVVSNVDTA